MFSLFFCKLKTIKWSCCICFKPKWTMRINNLKCESDFWGSCLWGSCFEVHFHYVETVSILRKKARSMREPLWVSWHFGGPSFILDVIINQKKIKTPANVYIKKKKLINKIIELFYLVWESAFPPQPNWTVRLWMRPPAHTYYDAIFERTKFIYIDYFKEIYWTYIKYKHKSNDC